MDQRIFKSVTEPGTPPSVTKNFYLYDAMGRNITIRNYDNIGRSLCEFYVYGNTRVVYSSVETNNNPVLDIQALTYYYPYGKILREYTNQGVGGVEKFKTTQHERDTETDWDYRGARYYDSDIGRFLSVDLLAEQFAGWTPYHYVHNNPINRVDPTGMAAEHIDVTKNDDGTYKVVGGQANSDKNIYVVDSNGKRTGEVVGEMLTEYSFHHEDGSAVIDAKIDLDDKSGQNFFNNKIKNIGLMDYISNAQGGEPLDFKMNDMPKGLTLEQESQYHYRGMSFNGKVASAKDIGNYSAGHNAGYPFFKQRQLQRQLQKATNPYPTGYKD